MKPSALASRATFAAFPPLSREEELALALRAKAGDRRAREKLVSHNLSWVYTVATKYKRGALPLDDLIQEGSLGVLRALEKFDPHAGTRFATYAIWWIHAYVLKYLQRARSCVRPARQTTALEDFSLDAPIAADGDLSHLELLEDEGPGPDEQVEQAQHDVAVQQALWRIRKRLKPLGWDVVHSRLAQDDPETLEAIGARHGVSRERVRQVEMQVKTFLATYLPEALGPRAAVLALENAAEVAPEPSSGPTPAEVHAETAAAAPCPEVSARAVAEPCPDSVILDHVRCAFPGLSALMHETAVDVALGLTHKQSAAKRGSNLGTMHMRRGRLFRATGQASAESVQATLLGKALEWLSLPAAERPRAPVAAPAPPRALAPAPPSPAPARKCACGCGRDLRADNRSGFSGYCAPRRPGPPPPKLPPERFCQVCHTTPLRKDNRSGTCWSCRLAPARAKRLAAAAAPPFDPETLTDEQLAACAAVAARRAAAKREQETKPPPATTPDERSAA